MGSAEQLNKFKIPVVHANPNVGEHLQDHLLTMVQFAINKEDNVVAADATGIASLGQYLFGRKGYLASAGIEATAFFHSSGIISQIYGS